MNQNQADEQLRPNTTERESDLPRFNPFAESFHDKRYEVYDRYLGEESIHWGMNATPSQDGSWYLFQHEDIADALKDPRFARKPPDTDDVKSRDRVPKEHMALWDLTTQWMLLNDPPRHTLIRKVFQKAFAKHFQPSVSSRITEIADDLVCQLQDSGTFDLVSEFSVPLPIRVISEMMGVPSEYEKDIRRWSQAVFLAVDLKNDRKKYEDGAAAAQKTSELLRELMAHKKRFPKDDVMSTVLCSEEGKQLSEDEALANLAFFLFAGNETTVGLVGNGILTLLRHRSQWERLSDNPNLLPSAVNEVLRFESPVQATTRFAQTDVAFRGENIRRGDHLCIMFGAGNRDPRQFSNPGEFDITRKPNRHFGFGHGPHFCIGSSLGLLEGKIALQTLLQKFPHLQLVSDELTWHNSVSLRSLKSLPVSPR